MHAWGPLPNLAASCTSTAPGNEGHCQVAVAKMGFAGIVIDSRATPVGGATLLGLFTYAIGGGGLQRQTSLPCQQRSAAAGDQQVAGANPVAAHWL